MKDFYTRVAKEYGTQIAKDYSKMIKERESKPKVYEAHGEGGSLHPAQLRLRVALHPIFGAHRTSQLGAPPHGRQAQARRR